MTRSPLIWSVIQQLGKQASSYIIFVILATRLAPRDFGLLGMAIVWISFMTAFSEVGFGAALIQRQQLESKHVSSTFYLNLGLGILLSLIGVISSWPFAMFLRVPDVQPVIAALSGGFFLSSLSLTQLAIAQREFRFRDLAIRDICATLIGGGVGIVLADLGYGVWSLVAQSLVASAVGTILIWKLSKWRPRLSEASWDCIKDLWGYSSKIFSFNVFKYFVQNTDKLLVGYFLGPVALGLYTFAYKIVVFPVASFIGAVGGYLFPKFSRMQHDLISIQSTYLLVIKATNSIVMPAMFIIGISAPTLTPLIFGQKWMTAVPLMQVFTIVAVAQSLISPVGQLMKALNRPAWLFNWSVFFTLMTALFVSLGIVLGMVGSGIGLSVSHVLALPVVYLITAKLIPLNVKLMLGALLPAIASSLVLSALLWFILNLDISSVSSKIVIGLLASCLSYAVMLTLIDKTFISTIFRRSIKA